MRCFLVFFIAALASATTPEQLETSSGVSEPPLKDGTLCIASEAGTVQQSGGQSGGMVLLQRPNMQFTHVELDDHGEPPTPLVLLETQARGYLKEVLEHEAMGILTSGEWWSRWTPHHKARSKGPFGVHGFLTSVVFFDWCLFASAIMVFLILHMLVLGHMEERGWHLAVLGIWLAVGAVYNLVIWGRFGSNAGISWFVGYVLEFIFLIENIFIFNIIINAFKTPVAMTTKALHIVVWCQILFEMIFFMGLAHWLRTFTVLPYILGVWLICCGLLAARGEPSFEGVIMETSACRAFTSCLGDRLSPSYEKDGECILRDDTGRMRMSLLGLVIAVLLTADFLLEIDVVLTKIEELPNPYIAFTSSAVAAFSIPELYFVSKGLLHRFKMLKYGIGFVLILFGAQMLLSSVYVLRPIIACGIIVGVLILCVVSSAFSSCFGSSAHTGNASEALAQTAEAGNPVANPQEWDSGDASSRQDASSQEEHAADDLRGKSEVKAAA